MASRDMLLRVWNDMKALASQPLICNSIVGDVAANIMHEFRCRIFRYFSGYLEPG